MTLSDFVSDAVRMIKGTPQYQPPSARFTVPAPRPPPAPSASVPDLSQAEPASLVASSSHKSGVSSDNRSTLISGR